MTSRSISEGFSEEAVSATAGKGCPSIESVGGICWAHLRYIFDFRCFCSRFFKRIFKLPEEAGKKTEQHGGRWNFQVEGRKVRLPYPNVIIGEENARYLSKR
jgi:hypothetical protein